MPISSAALFESQAASRRALVTGLSRAGLKVSRAEGPEDLGSEGLVVLGPSVKEPGKLVRRIRKALPKAVILAARKGAGKVAGVDGVLPLPISPADLRVRLPELERLMKLSRKPPGGKSTERLAEASGAAASVLDPHTHFYTFPHFKELLYVEVKRARRHGFPISLAIIAFDPLTEKVAVKLKAQLLGGLALAIRRSLRDTDFPVIDPQDRVVLLMPHTDLQGALVVCRRICERVARASLAVDGQILHPTISAGVAAAPISGEVSFSDLARQAQGALDNARAAGGNQVALPLEDPPGEPAAEPAASLPRA